MVNEKVVTITTTNDTKIGTAESVHKVVDEEISWSLFYQYSDFMSSNLDWLGKDIDVIINEASLEGISADFPIAI